MENKKLSPSTAIIISGILIAGSIIYVHKTGSAIVAPASDVKGSVVAAPQAESIALSLGMKKTALDQCVANQTYKSVIEKQVADGKAAGLKGTPFTALIRPDGKVITISGAQGYDDVKAIIDASLTNTDLASDMPTDIKVSPITAADHIRGNIGAPIQMIEFSDLQCPFCQKFHPTMQQVMQNYGSQVVWAYRHYPLTSIHDEAMPRALISECVSATLGQDAFWKFIDQMFK